MCPFLREARVKHCRASSVRKLIPLAQGALAGAAEARCGTPDHVSCKAFQAAPASAGPEGACPHFGESLMQYCGAASVAKLVPYSDSPASRCGSGTHRYCDLFLAMAHPQKPAVDGIEAPAWLRYSANHMWLDVIDDRVCYAGIDAFLARALGRIEGLTYVWQTGRRRPAAVLTVAGMDLEVVFPNPLVLTACNLHLRANPGRIAADPYAAGWLFEGVPLAETTAGLRQGAEARAWTDLEQGRMSEFLQQQTSPGAACDGGLFAPGLPERMERALWRACFHEFFTPDRKEEQA